MPYTYPFFIPGVGEGIGKKSGGYFAHKCLKVNKNGIFLLSTNINLISRLVSVGPPIISGEVAILQIPEDGSGAGAQRGAHRVGGAGRPPGPGGYLESEGRGAGAAGPKWGPSGAGFMS